MSRTQPHRPLLRVAAFAVSTALATMLSGCTSESASDLPAPNVVWDHGEPSGDLWDSPWAQAYIDARVQATLARVYGDYSDPATVEALGYDSAVIEASILADTRFTGLPNQVEYTDLLAEYAFYGTILDIEEAPDGRSARLDVCRLGMWMRDPVPSAEWWEISKNPDGSYSTEHQWGVFGPGDCPATPPWVARWEEPIDLDSITRETVKMPLPRDYYVDLGVISE